MAESAPAADAGPTRRFLTFRMGGRLYALPANEVSEVIRMPAVARVPQAPKGLLGLANLRGAVLPVASLRGLLGSTGAEAASSRAIVLDGPAPIAVAVDSVDALVEVGVDRIETGQVELAAEAGERLRGAFQPDGGSDVARILDLDALLKAAFVARPRERAADLLGTGAVAVAQSAEAAAVERLVSFDVAGQEFALPLAAVQEIIPAPETVAAVPRAETVVVGVAAYRGGLLPLLSLRGLIGFPPAAGADGRDKVVVTRVGGFLVGLVVDRMRAIIPAEPGLVEPTPPMLAARTGGESRIRAIYRGDGGRRLVSILAPDQLFREDVMQRLGAQAQAPAAAADEAATGKVLQVLVFSLGEDEFGLPIDVVDEVARVPEQITRIPKAPKFLEGVVNLRGDVLPVVDQRRRFDMTASQAREGRRLIVVRAGRHRAGLIVDAVSEVLRVEEAAIEPAPDLAGETTRLVNGVVNLEATGRLVLLLDPAELLTRTERGLLDAFEKDGRRARK